MIRSAETPVVAAFPGSLDPLMFSNREYGFELLFVVPRGSPEERWATSFLGPRQLLAYDVELGSGRFSDLNTDRVLQNSNLDRLLPQRDVAGLIITHRGTPAIARWSSDTGIRVIAPRLGHQLELEDKIAFEAFLIRHGLPKPAGVVTQGDVEQLSLACRKSNLGERLVVQDPLSFGSAGTWFCRSSELARLVDDGTIDPTREYLFRSRLDGPTYGISVFLQRGLIALSALRRQCFWPSAVDDGPGVFAGISWTADEELGEELHVRVDDVFTELGRLLYALSYRGFAHFDFIVDTRGNVRVLECNPRLSSATPQLFRFHELLGGVDAAPGFVAEALTPRPYDDHPRCLGLPASGFRGGLLDMAARGTTPLARTFPWGLYRLDGSRGVFETPDVRGLDAEGDRFVLYGECQVGERYEAGSTLASIISNFPLFDTEARATPAALELMEQFDHERT